ncbi:uncharacterized protein ACA1_097010 [Acanthamoeba castellanii str. Neff]|uniref:Uncharacterized protein n=1 Tax=Acanthamoeba castellanii (strain ATCC 30010 / Neff) TaxID=1257118 RepID=L8GJW3_ACACF|nr:uncharacterized protein ACA1_097010 [Acanthamoeba castellanii str. Neff]ELR13018.1 hypothetical protein ACA1_097010 [Acanthamoeba castellanii str. Neff]
MTLLPTGLALLLCVLVAAGSHNPLLFSEFNAQARNVTLYRLDNTAQTYNDVKLVAGLPNILGSGVTACNAKTCFVAPLSPSTGPVVFSIDLATKAVGYLVVPLAPPPYAASAAASEEHFFLATASSTNDMVAAVRLADGALAWTAYLTLPPLAVVPIIGRGLMVVGDAGLSDSKRVLIGELYDLKSPTPTWSAKYFTNGPEEVVAVTVDPRGSVMYVVQQKYSEQAWKDNVQTITTFSVPQSAQPGITHAIPRLEGSKLIAPVLLNGTQVLMFGQYPSDSMVKVFAYDLDVSNATIALQSACLLPSADTWSGASISA